ncbi:Hsp20/alpha crystallin family protein [Pedobacter frigiditerrae]|uniref:Hsp20/alpha crystallin family protein n=1 Tax=Pedobacter frigiditerrae TaxID=2530452 RepID=A0A4R0MPA5_9SPHI|nr:Hsp20/alpha crystallin family protein [Pedobacter frigiditerrae]TCC88062.1 Hsp20/alpha crystallin family protein [Pedobacter frigiditerrae]
MTLVKFNPEARKMLVPGLTDVFDSIFNDTFFTDRVTTRVPAANISETQDAFHVDLAAPGLKKEDFKINLERNVLTVSVTQVAEGEQEQRNYAKREFYYGSFLRTFTLPESANINEIQATYTDGVLQLHIPKQEEAKTLSRQIEIK